VRENQKKMMKKEKTEMEQKKIDKGKNIDKEINTDRKKYRKNI
jgi:hypothetical protein